MHQTHKEMQIQDHKWPCDSNFVECRHYNLSVHIHRKLAWHNRKAESPASPGQGKHSQTCPCQAAFQCRNRLTTIASPPCCSHYQLLHCPSAEEVEQRARSVTFLKSNFMLTPDHCNRLKSHLRIWTHLEDSDARRWKPVQFQRQRS